MRLIQIRGIDGPIGRASSERGVSRQTPAPRLPIARRVAAAAGRLLVALVSASMLIATTAAAAEDPLTLRGQEIEAWLPGFPKRALTELTSLLRQAEAATPAQRRYLYGLQGQAMIQAGKTTDALRLADTIEAEGSPARDEAQAATALLLRSGVQSWAGDSARANALAVEARSQAQASNDLFLRHWAALALGISSRQRGRVEQAMASLQEALALADEAKLPYRRWAARYQLSVLYGALKQPQKAQDESLEAFRQASAAKSIYGMAKSKMAESAALETLDKPEQELEAMQAALAIARNAKSPVVEGLALVNLADIELRRKDFRAAYENSRQALELAKEFDDASLVATAKANMGLALLGQGRIEAGKRLADEALAAIERTGATADIVAMLGEYGQYLEALGDHKGALALFHREQKMNEEISLAAHDKAVLELQMKFESEKRKREIEVLNHENDLKTAELQNRRLQQRVWWLLAALFALSFIVVAVLYRKLRVTNRLLAQKNVELSSQSSLDPLTALFNRRHFQQFIGEKAGGDDRRRGSADKPVQALLLIDLDHFKLVNDRFGHAAGDAVLVTVARRLRDALRETDMIVRWGGEEFLVFVPVAPIDRLDEIVQRIMNAIGVEPMSFQGHSIPVTVSIGYAPMPLPPHDVTLAWERAIGVVDLALYMAKVHGRNRAYGVCGLMRSDEEALLSVERDLEAAWKAGIVDIRALVGPESHATPTTGAPHALGANTRH